MSPTESEYRKIQYGCQATILKVTIARENSPVTQTTPEPTLLSWGGGGGVDHAKKFPSPLATQQARSYGANRATQALWSCSGVSRK